MEERRKQVLWATVILAMIVFQAAEAKKVHIPDELDDVVDEDEDEEWKAWGKSKPKPPPPFDPPPDDLSSLSPLQIQEEMLKRHMGTAMGFVKLRLGVQRSKDEITSIAEKWTKLLRTGSISAKIMAVDVNTIMFIIEDGQSIAEEYIEEFKISRAFAVSWEGLDIMDDKFYDGSVYQEGVQNDMQPLLANKWYGYNDAMERNIDNIFEMYAKLNDAELGSAEVFDRG
ncbi:hypothetical protein L7F22_034379 [Adiantum nelumboides]|nr:hypothetical protein [Adiantum nelumboides]